MSRIRKNFQTWKGGGEMVGRFSLFFCSFWVKALRAFEEKNFSTCAAWTKTPTSSKSAPSKNLLWGRALEKTGLREMERNNNKERIRSLEKNKLDKTGHKAGSSTPLSEG